MWQSLPAYFTRGACIDELLQHLVHAGIFYARVQLTIREGAGSTFAKLYVGIRIEHPRTPETLHLLCPCVNVGAPLNQDRPLPGLGQNKRGKQARGTGAGNHRAALQGSKFGQLINNRLTGFDPRVLNSRLWPGNLTLDRTNKADVVFLPCVHRLFNQRQSANPLRFHMQPLCRQGAELLLLSV